MFHPSKKVTVLRLKIHLAIIRVQLLLAHFPRGKMFSGGGISTKKWIWNKNNILPQNKPDSWKKPIYEHRRKSFPWQKIVLARNRKFNTNEESSARKTNWIQFFLMILHTKLNCNTTFLRKNFEIRVYVITNNSEIHRSNMNIDVDYGRRKIKYLYKMYW